MVIRAVELKTGDIIHYGHKETKVTHLDVNSCKNNGVHVNKRFCYSRHAELTVTRLAEKKSTVRRRIA